MARINNKPKYPIKSEPNENDYIIGTDSENNNKTVSFNISSLTTEGTTDYSSVPAYDSHDAAFLALGAGKLFRYSQTNTNGVVSPIGSVLAITQIVV